MPMPIGGDQWVQMVAHWSIELLWRRGNKPYSRHGMSCCMDQQGL